MRRLITSIVLLFFLAACGQKGALYLPEKNTNKNTNATHNGQPKHDASFY
ncbi:MAG: lipoprotein [Gammaproteobacteria bacterium]|nr:lipoprotein [Gammaproteobacteria bacterium]